MSRPLEKSPSLAEQRLLLLVALDAACRLALFERLEHAGVEVHVTLEFFVALDHLFGLVDAALHHLHVGENQLQIDRLNVACRVDAALDVNDVVVLKAAHHMHNRVALADVGEKLVSQALALGCALDQTRDVDKLDRCGGVFVGVIHFGKHIETLVGNRHHADVRLDGAERIVGALCARIGDGVKQGALSHVGKTYNT